MIKKLLVGDIGGTNTALGVLDLKSNELLSIKNFLTNKINLEKELQKILNQTNVLAISLAVAGPVKKGEVKLTNVNKKVSSKELSDKLKINVLVINDFEALGYYIKKRGIKNCVVVGPGTGLGKVIVSDKVRRSEGGHVVFPFESKEEKMRLFFEKKLKRPPEYEDFVSGRGVIALKNFFSNKKLKEHELVPENIFSVNNDLNQKTIRTFSKFFARFIRNTYLEILFDNIFVAGGIIRKNPWILELKEFKKELGEDISQKIKISIIEDEHAELRGACNAFLEINK